MESDRNYLVRMYDAGYGSVCDLILGRFCPVKAPGERFIKLDQLIEAATGYTDSGTHDTQDIEEETDDNLPLDESESIGD